MTEQKRPQGRPKLANKKKRYSFTLDENIKEEATKILNAQGFTLSGAIEMFLRSVIDEQGFSVNFHVSPSGQKRIQYAMVALPTDSSASSDD